MSFPSWPYFADDEISTVVDVLKSGKVSQWTGQHVTAFENEFANFHGCKYGVALANGTVALELALLVLGIEAGDEVIVTPRSFVASASTVVLRGATPIFVDVDPVSQNITAESIEAAITPKTKAIICVHLAGWPCEMDKIVALAERHNIKVIEDCAQSHGAKYKGKPVGSWGDVAAFSFCQDKIMTTGGEGGMLTTNNEAWWRKAWTYKDHGKNYDSAFSKNHAPGFRWLHDDFGTNWRMTEIQAAIGRQQLKKLPLWLEKRKHFATMLNEAFAKIPAVRLTIPNQDTQHAYYKYYFFIRPEMLEPEWSRDKLIAAILERGVPCFSGSCSEMYLEKCFVKNGLQPNKRLTNAKVLGETSIMLLVHPTLNDHNIQKAIEIISDIFSHALAKVAS